MKVMITGGTGFIGRRLVAAALERGWQVSVLVRRPDGEPARRLAAQGASLVMGDITDRESLARALDVVRPSLLFHNAGWYELGLPRRARRKMWAVNVEATEVVLTLAAQAGVGKTVYTSTAIVFGDTRGEVADEQWVRAAEAQSTYETTKTEAHRVAQRHQRAGEPIVIVAPSQVVGPGDPSSFGHMARAYARGRVPRVGWAPDSTFTFGHVEDVAEGMVRAGEAGRPGETYLLGGHVMTVRDMMRIWAEAGGRKPPAVWLPRPIAVAQATLAGPLLRLAGQPAYLSPEAVCSSFVSLRFSSEKARRELGASFRPADQAWRETLQAELDRLDAAA
jgi:dihydroflavonol-4-reductase